MGHFNYVGDITETFYYCVWGTISVWVIFLAIFWGYLKL